MPEGRERSRQRGGGTAPRKRFRLRPWRLLLFVLFVSVLAVAGTGLGFVVGAVEHLPSAGQVEEIFTPETSFIYDRDGNLVTEIHGPENRVSVEVEDIPERVQHAFVAIEDERFYEHFGIDPRGILRAAVNNLTGGELQGASTITQQLARTLFPREIGRRVTFERKVQEGAMAIRLERHFTKDRILEMYLNQIYLGENAYGIEAAAQIYFGKSVRNLSLAEAALLAGLTKGPSVYSPFENPRAAVTRRNVVLDTMVEQGFISAGEAAGAKREDLELAEREPYGQYPAPYYVDFVVQRLLDEFAARYEEDGEDPAAARQHAARTVYAGGLKIYTALDQELQQLAEQAVAEVMDRDFPVEEGDDNPRQAATVSLDVSNGEVLAMVGGRSFRANRDMLEFNRAWQAKRQPGSAFKPIAVYGSALAEGWTPGRVIDDTPVEYEVRGSEPYFPRNYDFPAPYEGLMTLREALRISQNVPAVKTLHAIGVETGIRYTQLLGIDTLDLTTEDDGKSDLNLSLALGGLTRGVTVLDMAEAYGTFANMGVRSEPYAIRRVVGKHGDVLLENRPQQEVVFEEDVAWLMTDILKNVIAPHRVRAGGTGRAAQLADGRPAAGKTGTTTEYKDVWFVGYTPQRVTTVWIGHDQPERMPRSEITSGRQPVEIWKQIMEGAHADLEAKDWPEPPNIVKVGVCMQSGLLPGPYCPDSKQYTEVFIRGTEPTEVGEIWKPFRVCKEDPNLLYEPGCSCTPSQRVFLDREPVEPLEKTIEGRTYTLTVDDMQVAPPTETCQTSPRFQSGVVRMKVYGSSFEPMVIWNGAQVGRPLTIYATAVEAPARLLIPAFDVEVDLPQGETVTVRFVPDEAGRFPLEVRVGNYRLRGYLVVQTAPAEEDGTQDDEESDDTDTDRPGRGR